MKFHNQIPCKHWKQLRLPFCGQCVRVHTSAQWWRTALFHHRWCVLPSSCWISYTIWEWACLRTLFFWSCPAGPLSSQPTSTKTNIFQDGKEVLHVLLWGNRPARSTISLVRHSTRGREPTRSSVWCTTSFATGCKFRAEQKNMVLKSTSVVITIHSPVFLHHSILHGMSW